MNTFVLLMIFASCTVEYLTQAGLLPHGVKYSAEIISGLTLIMGAAWIAGLPAGNSLSGKSPDTDPL